jgi:hypothetical protein
MRARGAVMLRCLLRQMFRKLRFQMIDDRTCTRRVLSGGFPCGLVFAAIGGVIAWLGGSKKSWRERRLFGYGMIGFACLWSGVMFSSTFSEYVRVRSAYRRSQFKVVEGRVTDFRPMPYEGHQDECFSVQSQTFCYSDYEVTAGFNNSASHGGPIRDGLPVRVSYVGNTIVRLEVSNPPPNDVPKAD